MLFDYSRHFSCSSLLATSFQPAPFSLSAICFDSVLSGYAYISLSSIDTALRRAFGSIIFAILDEPRAAAVMPTRHFPFGLSGFRPLALPLRPRSARRGSAHVTTTPNFSLGSTATPILRDAHRRRRQSRRQRLSVLSRSCRFLYLI